MTRPLLLLENAFMARQINRGVNFFVRYITQ